MRLNKLSEDDSPSKRGVRSRKKHKRLDAISEDVFNRNREGGFGDRVGNEDSELRRSSRVRKAPEVLDSSPPPKRTRRRNEKVGRGGGLMGKGKGKREVESKEDSSEEELGSWRLRSSLRTKRKGKVKKSFGKRKLFKGVEDEYEDEDEDEDEDENEDKDEDEDEDGRAIKEFSEEKEMNLDGEKSGDEEGSGDDSVEGTRDVGEEIEDDHSPGERVAGGVDEMGNEEAGDCTRSTSRRVNVNEEIGDGGCAIPAVKEREVSAVTMIQEKADMNEDHNEVPVVTMIEEKVDRNEHMGETSQTDKPVNSSERVEDAETQSRAMEIDPLPTDLNEVGNDDMTKDCNVGEEVRHRELENGLKVKSNNIATSEMPRPRIKEGRRCGLCGGGTDGKPPKKFVTDSGGSEQEAYSGSSASEEFTYDPWDGFGDESGWLGKLLGPVNDRLGIARIWVHQHCAVWSPEVYFASVGCLKNIRSALCRGRTLKCTRCGRPGATLGCRVDRCPRTYHLPCARASGCNFDHRKFLIACADHRYLFEPEYSQRIKKLKAKKMKFEVRKLSNDASRKDLEAEEKWMDKCGEDEEFLRRETKRLQRDLLRIAPVYIGGSHSEGENPIGGWESVAGLQNVVQCMKEVVILPLLYPDFYGNMGITPPRGVLLHGYPGTGKTLVVRALIGSCARGDKRIAYFARKGADCLGKYVGDAERQLRLLFQVAEKSQPSIIFFDEIDGLAPVRTRQQDQTHSSVVSTLLALMDGLKSRGSVIVIGATNRPDSVDPALRRPGRFDREIYFPLPSVKDRAAILALHTRKWPKPVSGPLLEWVSTKTIGFAGADLQALCAQAAVIALKRNCSWHKVLSCAAENPVKGRRPELPSFEVEERDWLEALSLAPPPCSRREAGMAANEVLGTPLDVHLIPCLLQPLLSLILSFYLDDRLWLPLCLVAAGRAIEKAVISQMGERNLQKDKWACHAQKMAQDPNNAREIVRNLISVGIVKGDASLTGFDITKDASFEDGGIHQYSFGDNPSGLHRNVRYAPLKNTGYRVMISGAPRCGQKYLASCLLHCFLGNLEIQKIDLATISQEGHGDMEQGILRILMKCASLRMCVIFMPRIDFWAIESHSQSVEQDVEVSPVHEPPVDTSMMPSQVTREECNSKTSDLVGVSDTVNEICCVSRTWKIFREQLECLCVSSSSIILATSELPFAALPCEIRQFFGSQQSASEGPCLIEHGTPRFSVEVNGELDQNELIHLSAVDLSRNLIRQFVHVAHLGSHQNSDPSIVQENQFDDKKDTSTQDSDLIVEPGASTKPSEDSVTKLLVPPGYRNLKDKSTLVVAVTTFGYQILRYPHFAELCWATSKLKEGPSADIRGPWNGWPFNSCIIRPGQLMQNDDVACNSRNISGKDKFKLVRGLIAVGLSAYRGVYKSSREVSLEVRKVLKLLVGQISARIQSGKDRYQYIRLLSQVAYLEDMVNNWSHSLRSLEPEDQTPVTICNLSGASSPENRQAITVEPMEVEEKPNTGGSGFQELQHATGGLQGPTAANFEDINLDVPADSTQGEGFQKAELVEGGSQISMAECSQLADLPTAVDNVGVNNHTDCESTDEMSPEKAAHVNVDNQKDIEITDEMSPEKAAHVSVDNQKDFERTDELSPEKAQNHGNDVHLPGLNSSCETREMPSKLEVLCCYTCCSGCISTLQELVKKIIIRCTEHSGSICTVEDIHDLVSALSTNLCSAVRNLYITGESPNAIFEKLNSGIFRNLDSQELFACQCVSSESSLTKLMDCGCHSEKYVPEELKSPSSYYQPRIPFRYIFRDGVLVSADPDKESSFHCKYDTLCLCSLINLIVCNKLPVD
ncbi:uncharacterized protein LOC141646995 [Silene latifolia]|uniref:uncharacterized protein LOC141646995 n=1 Tax=Silene latifolia TaxID=37657 RepID=UPI003D78559C